MAPWFREESLGRRLLLAMPLIDPLYFTVVDRFDRCDLDRRHRQAYYAWLFEKIHAHALEVLG